MQCISQACDEKKGDIMNSFRFSSYNYYRFCYYFSKACSCLAA